MLPNEELRNVQEGNVEPLSANTNTESVLLTGKEQKSSFNKRNALPGNKNGDKKGQD